MFQRVTIHLHIDPMAVQIVAAIPADIHAYCHPQQKINNRVELTSLVDVSRNLALVRLARPSMFMVPRKLVLSVLMGLYLHTTKQMSCRRNS